MTATPVFTHLYRVVYKGHTPGGETFQFGYWATLDVAGLDSDMLSNAGDWLTAYLSSPALSVGATDVRHIFGSGLGFDEISVRPYTAATGLPIRPATIGSIAVVGAGVGQWPPQDSLVMSLWNGRATGKRKYNRFFQPPMETSVLDLTGRVFSGLPGDLNVAVLAGEAALEAASVVSGMCYYGSVDHDVLGLVEAQCDDVVDTHRSRRAQLVPVRTHTSF